MSHCPSEDTIADFVEGRLTGETLTAFYGHVAACPVCTATLAALSRSSAPASSSSNTKPTGTSDRGHDPSAVHDWSAQADGAGRYRPLEIRGAGGMGIVYLACDNQLKREVALKITRAGVSQASALRLLREAQAMARLSHRNVVTVHDVGIWRDHVFVAMEYVKGGPLARHLLDKKRSWQEILDTFVQAGFGLAAAHRAGLVHRDFKPENVLVSATGEIRVADFGLARWLTEAGPGPSIGTGDHDSRTAPTDVLRIRLTRAGTLLGTPAYMPPEQVRGEPVDHRADMWSFCAALYEALHCELPFPGRTPHEVLEHAERNSIRRPPVGCDVPSWLRKVLLRGLHARPAQRYAGMDELLEALTAASHGRKRGRRAFAAAAIAVTSFGLGAPFVWRVHDRFPARKDLSTRHSTLVTATSRPLPEATSNAVTPRETDQADSMGIALSASSIQKPDRALVKQQANSSRPLRSPSADAIPTAESERFSVRPNAASATEVPPPVGSIADAPEPEPLPIARDARDPPKLEPAQRAPIIRD